MSEFIDTIHHATETAETFDDIERLDRVVDALAAQALGRSEILLEQFGSEQEDPTIVWFYD